MLVNYTINLNSLEFGANFGQIHCFWASVHVLHMLVQILSVTFCELLVLVFRLSHVTDGGLVQTDYQTYTHVTILEFGANFGQIHCFWVLVLVLY